MDVAPFATRLSTIADAASNPQGRAGEPSTAPRAESEQQSSGSRRPLGLVALAS
jgi:hypothetical protein